MDELKLIDGNLPQAICEEIANVEREAKRISEKQKNLKARVLEIMEENDVLKIDNNILSITYVGTTTSETLDSKALREDLPEIYDTYCKITTRGAYIKIKTKETTDGDMGD